MESMEKNTINAPYTLFYRSTFITEVTEDSFTVRIVNVKDTDEHWIFPLTLVCEKDRYRIIEGAYLTLSAEVPLEGGTSSLSFSFPEHVWTIEELSEADKRAEELAKFFGWEK